MLVQLQGIGKSFGGSFIFRHIDWTVPDKVKLGLVGPNGAGKSTLLKLIHGVEDVDEGAVTRRKAMITSYLPQHVGDDLRTALQIGVSLRTDIHDLEARLDKIADKLAAPEVATDLTIMDRLLIEQQAVLEKMDRLGVSGLEGEITARLRDLGLSKEELQLPLTQLSGGQRKMAMLVACLMRRPDLLLLDEPETHLDLRARSRLERMVRSLDCGVIIVSHDRYLLDETVRHIVQIDEGSVTHWEGNYSSYVVQRQIALKRQEVLFTAQRKEIERLEEAIRRFRQWANEMPDSADNSRHIKQARNKERQIESMEKVDRPVLERRRMALSLHEQQRSGVLITELKAIGLTIAGRELLRDVNLEIRRSERVGVVGSNGAGKTLLAKLVSANTDPTSGAIRWGPSVQTAYFSQNQDTLPSLSTPVELVRLARPMREDEAVSHLMKFLFRYEQIRQPVERLSGGEKSRLQLLKLMLGEANFLVLDEPTNHLDIESMEVLENALDTYPGTVLAVSHDRYFLDRISERIVEIANRTASCHLAGYTHWDAA